MRYLPPGSMRRQRWLGRLEGSIAALTLVCLLGFGFIAATPTELYRPAPATYHRVTTFTKENRQATFRLVNKIEAVSKISHLIME